MTCRDCPNFVCFEIQTPALVFVGVLCGHCLVNNRMTHSKQEECILTQEECIGWLERHGQQEEVKP